MKIKPTTPSGMWGSLQQVFLLLFVRQSHNESSSQRGIQSNQGESNETYYTVVNAFVTRTVSKTHNMGMSCRNQGMPELWECPVLGES